MIEEILPDLYKIEIPLPKNPLGALNSFVIKNSERNLVIDTGFNQDECLRAMKAGLKELEIDARKTDFFITHMHPDHLGLASSLATDTSKIFFNQPEADLVTKGVFLDESTHFACRNGFPENELPALHYHPGFKFFKTRSERQVNFHILKEGDPVSISDYLFKCVQTPGHTIGHMCLYEPNKKIFLAGDHILNDITATIQLWSDQRNPLKNYLESLDKVYELDIELVLPGHKSMIRNCKERIQELKLHHQSRLDEILSILAEGDKNAFQIASQMSWDTTCDSWESFPSSQKWIATGEAIAHLKYLEEKGQIQKDMQGAKIVFSLKPGKS